MSCYTTSAKTRKEHLQIMRAIAKNEGADKAMKYWLTEAPRISKKAYMEAIR